MHHLESVFSCVVFGLIFVSSSYVFCHSRFTPGDFFHMMDRAHEESLYPQVSRHRNPVYGAIWGTLKIGGLKNPSYTHEPAWTIQLIRRYCAWTDFLNLQSWESAKMLQHDTPINFMFEVQELDWWWAIWARWRESHDWFPWLRTLYRPILRGVLCYGIGGPIPKSWQFKMERTYVATKFGVVFRCMLGNNHHTYRWFVCVFFFFFVSSPSFCCINMSLYLHDWSESRNFSRLESYAKSKPKPFCSQAVKMVRGEMGLKNVEIMIPFVRTLDMAKDVNEVLESWLTKGLKWLVVSSMFYFHPYVLPGKMIQFE